MKKIIFSLILITLLCGCDNLANDKICNEGTNTTLITLTFNGESHEFVQYVSSGPANKAGIAHWPGCIYCNRQNQEGNPDSIQQAK